MKNAEGGGAGAKFSGVVLHRHGGSGPRAPGLGPRPARGWGLGGEDEGTSEGPSVPHPCLLSAARQSLGVRSTAKSSASWRRPHLLTPQGKQKPGRGISAGPRAPPHGAGKLGSWPSALGPQGAGKARRDTQQGGKPGGCCGVTGPGAGAGQSGLRMRRASGG